MAGKRKMSELMIQPDKLRANAAECAVIRDFATDRDKRTIIIQGFRDDIADLRRRMDRMEGRR